MQNFLKTYAIYFLILSLGLGSCSVFKKEKDVPTLSLNDIRFKEVFHEANSEKMIEHFEKAIQLFEECININPQSAASFFALSEIYYDLKNYTKSIDMAQSAFDINPKNKWYAIQLAELFYEQSSFLKSEIYLEKAVFDFEDKNIELKSKLASAYIFNNKYAKAIELLDLIEVENGIQVMTSVTKHDLYNELGKNEEAKAELNKLLDDAHHNLSIHSEAMEYFFKTRQSNNAEYIIDRIISIDSSNAIALIGKSKLALENNDVDEAFKWLNKGLNSNNIDINEHLYLIESLSVIGFEKRHPISFQINQELEKVYAGLFEKYPKNIQILELYGQYLVQNNQIDKSLIIYNQLLALQPATFDAWKNVLNAYYFADDFENLKVKGMESISIFPSQPIFYLLTSIGFQNTDNIDKAIELQDYGKDLVVENEPLKNDFLYYKAISLWLKGSEAESKIEFEKIFLNNPNNDKYYIGLAELLLNNNEFEESIIFAKKACEINNRNPENLFIFSKALFKLKQYDEAKSNMERAVGIDIYNYEYMNLLGDLEYFLGDIEKAVLVWKEAYNLNNLPSIQKKIDNKKYVE